MPNSEPYDERTVQAMLQLAALCRCFAWREDDGDNNYAIVRWPAHGPRYHSYFCLEGLDPEVWDVDEHWINLNWDHEEHLHEMPLPLIMLALADLEVAHND